MRNGFIHFADITEGKVLTRENLGLIIVSADLFIMVCFLLAIWFITYAVRVDAERHRNLLFETKEFALEFYNLPKLHPKYSMEVLKAELWDHIEKVILTEP